MASKLLPDAVKEERALLSLKKEAFYDATDGIGLPSDLQDAIWTSFNRIGPCVCGGCEGVVCFRTNSTYPPKGRGPVLDEHIATFWKLVSSRRWPECVCTHCGKIMKAGDRNRVKDKSNGGWRCREGRFHRFRLRLFRRSYFCRKGIAFVVIVDAQVFLWRTFLWRPAVRLDVSSFAFGEDPRVPLKVQYRRRQSYNEYDDDEYTNTNVVPYNPYLSLRSFGSRKSGL